MAFPLCSKVTPYKHSVFRIRSIEGDCSLSSVWQQTRDHCSRAARDSSLPSNITQQLPADTRADTVTTHSGHGPGHVRAEDRHRGDRPRGRRRPRHGGRAPGGRADRARAAEEQLAAAGEAAAADLRDPDGVRAGEQVHHHRAAGGHRLLGQGALQLSRQVSSELRTSGV